MKLRGLKAFTVAHLVGLLAITQSHFAGAQDQRIADSLVDVLATVAYNDSLRVVILSQIAFNHNDPSIALSYANEILEIAEKRNENSSFYQAYYLIGTSENKQGNLENAIDAFMKASTYADLLGNNGHLAQVYLSLGDVYSNQENQSNSIFYYKKAIEILESRNDPLSIAAALTNLGYEYYRIDFTDSALIYFEKATEFFQSIDYEIGALYCLGNAGLVYAKTGDYKLAEEKMQEAIIKLSDYQDYYAISDFEKEMAEIYRVKGNYQEALRYASSSLKLAEENGFKIQARDASEKLYDIHTDMELFQKANMYLIKYFALRDSIINAENIQRIADLRTEYEVGLKQTEVDLLTVQKRNREIILFAVAGFALIFLILAFIIYKYYQSRTKTNRILEQQKQELESLNHTKDKFFSIISHDLRGPVSSFHGISRMIKYLVASKETDQLIEVADDIDQSVDQISALLDNLLGWAMQQQGHFPNVPEKLHLNEMADDLVKTLANMAKGKSIALSSEIESDIFLWADKNMTMTILRNLVNNSLKFTPEGGSVTIRAYEDGDNARIEVVDTGVGIPEAKLKSLFRLQDKKSTYGTSGEKGLGLGLLLVYEFIEMNRGTIRVESRAGEGTRFVIQMPVYERAGASVHIPHL